VRRELEQLTAPVGTPPLFDRLAASGKVWAALAASLLALLATGIVSSRGFQARIGAMLEVEAGEATGRREKAIAGLEREVLALFPGSEARSLIRSRLQLSSSRTGKGTERILLRREWLDHHGSGGFAWKPVHGNGS